MMYDSELECGVLTDFDSSILQWEPRIIGTDRTGTIPFMAIDILTDGYWQGLTKRYHRHELESFFWILVFVCLLYQGGKRYANEYADSWMTSDYRKCREKKADFLTQDTPEQFEARIQSDFKPFWNIIKSLWRFLLIVRLKRTERLLEPSKGQAHVIDSKESWEFFTKALADAPPSLIDEVNRLATHQPVFEDLTQDEARKLRRKYAQLLGLETSEEM
jgi:hypothetical protein